MTGLRVLLTACLVLTGLFTGMVSSGQTAVAAPGVSLVRDTQLDATALYFVSFDGLVNNESFQQDGILTFAGFQYTAWYTADRSAVVARRQVPSGAWEKVVLPHK